MNTSTPPETKHQVVSSEELLLLREKLREAQETLEAIRSGEVDAVVVQGDSGSHIYTLVGAEEPYRVYVEQMQEGAVTVSAEGTILYANQKFAEFLGSGLERVIGSDARAFMGNALWDTVSKAFASSRVLKVEADLQRGDGRTLPVMISASRLAMGGEMVGCLVVTDLSAQRETSALNAAKEVAEAANQAKDSFLAVLSHELRTPLTPVLMGICLLENEPDLSDRGRELVTMIRRNVEMEIRLIDDLLDLTRVTQGKIQLNRKAIDLHTIIRQAASVCQSDLTEKSQTLKLDLAATHSRVMGDGVRLQQVLWNLIRNASKFSPRGAEIIVSSSNSGESRIDIQVADQGVGIEPDVLQRLFSPFEQGGDETTRRYGGLGLGLVISKSIIGLHDGGAISATSPGRDLGATFTFSLNHLPEKRSAPESSSSGSILLVEDNADTRLALGLLLESLGFQVHAAACVAEGLGLARTARLDLVISDVGLPDGTGYDLMQEISQRYGVRGIALSGFGMPEDVTKSLEAGFDIHLTKPVLASDLEAAISKVRLAGA